MALVASHTWHTRNQRQHGTESHVRKFVCTCSEE